MSQNLSDTIKLSIDSWCARLRRECGLVRVAQQGAFGPRALGLYLESLRYQFVHSQENLVAGAERADALGLPELSEFFRAKVIEERGHDQWAIDDMLQLPRAATAGLRPAAASVALVQLQVELVAQHPICMLAYAVWAEYLTALLGAEWLAMLANSGYQRTQVSAVANHVEADDGHALAGLAALDRFWQGTPATAQILEAVSRAQALFEAFCDEICELAEPTLGGHVSANLPS
jgi:hypothetical protein